MVNIQRDRNDPSTLNALEWLTVSQVSPGIFHWEERSFLQSENGDKELIPMPPGNIPINLCYVERAVIDGMKDL